MQIAINNNPLPEMAFSLDGQTLRPLDEDYRLLPSLRPLWGLLPRCRGYNIRPVQTTLQQSMANMLVQQMYTWRGYSTDYVNHQLDDPNHLTLAAWQYDEVVATLTLGRDSPDGLQADSLYADELAGLRRPGRVVCEVTRLAVDPDFSSHDLLNALFMVARQYGKDTFAASDAVIEVNPRHTRYYQQSLGFRQIGKLRQCPRVDAPAVLLHRPMDDIDI
ncbi:hypothetical protein [Propionivibrio sp.]|uniref:N-acyl amino acid synthase FeeM domain-containing protein n=1 Tax=Propionivibrio sp. TaxID=2212460 RepID=UPI0025EA30E7|nr:hypothetical protein [Propionivibrio sp.]MBK7355590.1 N-acetyltransferase [Propionivibrio sp.]MBK8400740.1 N-acetyltransferase [Propionivibrio sp.]MBK8744769.1 N-acetyltransferase [Propionivibrio sp.]MBK8893255.1 N-acetyltransferase [Propionivibrio sp.]MBL0207773.1 N-acetyltransferase [Propionivibrio sp.]